MKLFIISTFLFFITTQSIIYWNCYYSKLDEKFGNIITDQSFNDKSAFIVLMNSSEPNSYRSSNYLYKCWFKGSKCRKYEVIDR